MMRLSVMTVLLFVLTLLTGCGNGDNKAPGTQRELFVCNLYNVSLFDASLSGNVTPLTVFAQATDSDRPAGITVDVINNEIFVAGRDSITVYTKTSAGAIVPARRISGVSTALAAPSGIAVDATRNEIFVTNFSNDSITVYARTAEGNIAPLRNISGDATGLDGVRAIAVDTANNEILVTTRGAHIKVFAKAANGNVAPVRTISFSGPAEFSGIALDTVNNEILVTRFTIIDRYHFSTSVTVYERTAEGDAVPLRTILGEPSGLAGAMTGIAVDPKYNELFVAHSSSNSIAVYKRTATGNASPLRILSGDSTGLNAPSVLAMGAL